MQPLSQNLEAADCRAFLLLEIRTIAQSCDRTADMHYIMPLFTRLRSPPVALAPFESFTSCFRARNILYFLPPLGTVEST